MRAYQLRSRAASTSADDTEKSGSETSKYGTSDVIAMTIIVNGVNIRCLAPGDSPHLLPAPTAARVVAAYISTSSDLSSSGRRHDCSTIPMRLRHSRVGAAGSAPSTETLPPSRRRYPSRISTVVVLPAPFGPRMANTSPAPMRRSTPATASCAP